MRLTPAAPTAGATSLTRSKNVKSAAKWHPEEEIYCKTGDEGYCEKCIVERMKSDYALFTKYLKAFGWEKEFFIWYVFRSNPEGVSYELLDLAKRDFENGLKSSLREKECREMIAEYVADNGLTEAAEIIDEN